MDKVSNQRIIEEKEGVIVDMKANYNTWRPSQNHLDTERSDFYSEEDEKKILVPQFNDYFRRKAVNLEWRNISLKTSDGKKILDGLDGFARSGELTAIMGPSGAGKTSLLHVLTGYIQKRVTGHIYVNGVPVDISSYRKLTCYILQDVHILDRFTVKELVTIASRLKLPSTISEKQRKKIVENCICSFGLEAQQNQRANTLSGGQRKRLCIAQEIVNNPPLIFLDEPTSGLDSASCFQCMQLLKSLALEGRNIICSIHQPSSRVYETMDNIYMISEGQCIYRGPTKNLLPFLANQGLKCPKYHSPTDFLIDVAIGLYGDWNWKLRNATDSADDRKSTWYEIDSKNIQKPKSRSFQPTSLLSLFKTKVKNTKKEDWLDDSSSDYATGFCNQFMVLLKRSFMDIIRAPILLLLKLAASIAVGLMFGALYYNTGNDGSLIFNTSSFLFILMVFLIVSAKLPTILAFPMERIVFEREHMNGWYSSVAYYLARTSATIPLQVIFPIVTSTITYQLSGQPQELPRLGFFLLSSVMISLISESVGFMLGAAFSPEISICIDGVIQSPQLMLSGALLPGQDIPEYLQWSTNLMHTKYAINSMFKNIFMNRAPLECRKKFCFFRNSEKFLQFMGMTGDMYTDYLVMLGFLLSLRIFGFLVLYIKASIKR